MSDTESCPIFLLIYYHLCCTIYSTFIEKIQGNTVPIKQKSLDSCGLLPRLCELSTREGKNVLIIIMLREVVRLL